MKEKIFGIFTFYASFTVLAGLLNLGTPFLRMFLAYVVSSSVLMAYVVFDKFVERRK